MRLPTFYEQNLIPNWGTYMINEVFDGVAKYSFDTYIYKDEG